jgi:hypothetical protein
VVKALEQLKPLFCKDGEVLFWTCNTCQNNNTAVLKNLATILGVKVSGLKRDTDTEIISWNDKTIGPKWVTVYPPGWNPPIRRPPPPPHPFPRGRLD